MKVAIVCDWLTGIGGAERVVLALHNLYPEAPIYTSQYDPKSMPWFSKADVRTTWLQKVPKKLRKFLPILRAWSFSHLDLSDYDLVISSSGAEAKAVKVGPTTIHIAYCHSPTHYYWFRYDEYLKHPGFGALDPLARLGLKILAGPMRRWDRRAAQKADYIIANSSFTQANIKKYYGRDSVVIHPPVDIERFSVSSKEKRHGFLIVGRQTPYKRFDLAVGAATKNNQPLTVIGNGPDHLRLQKMAGRSVTFITDVDELQLPSYFNKAEAFIFPNIDDFGVVAVEALASGTPVIAFNGGGSLDFVKPNETGLLFNEQTVESLSKVMTNFSNDAFSSSKIAEAAKKYSTTNFDNAFKTLVRNCLVNLAR